MEKSGAENGSGTLGGGPGSGTGSDRPHPSRRSASVWNLIFAYAGTALAIVRNLALVPIFLMFIELDVYGAWLATGAVLAQLMVFDFGLLGVMTQRVAAAYGARDYDGLGKIIGTSLLTALGLSLSASLLAASVWKLVPGLVSMENENAEVLALCFLIVALSAGLNLVALAAGSILTSLQRPLLAGIGRIGSDILDIVVTLVLIFHGHGLLALALGIAIRSVAASINNVAGCLWVCARVLGLQLRWERATAKTLWKYSIIQAFNALAMRLQTTADPFVIGVILGPTPAAVYALTIRAHETVRLLWGQFSQALTPSLAHLYGSRNLARFREVLPMMALVTALLGALGIGGVIAFNDSFVGLWIGADRYGGDAITVLFGLFGVCAMLGVTPYAALFAKGDYLALCKIMWITTLVRWALLVALLQMGLWGVPVAAASGALLRTTLLHLKVNQFTGFARHEIVPLVRRLVSIGLPPFVLGLCTLVWFPILESWSQLVLAGIGFLAVCLAVLFVLDRKLLSWLSSETAAVMKRPRPGGTAG